MIYVLFTVSLNLSQKVRKLPRQKSNEREMIESNEYVNNYFTLKRKDNDGSKLNDW